MKMENYPGPGWGKGSGGSRVRSALTIAIGLWYGYAAVENVAAVAIGSIALAANSIGHITIASAHVLLLCAPPSDKRKVLTIALSAIVLVPFAIMLTELWQRLAAPLVPRAALLAWFGAGAILVDLVAAAIIARLRPGSMSVLSGLKALLWPRTITNPMIMLAALATATTGSAWHDFLIGLGIALSHAVAVCAFWRAGRTIS